MLYPKFGWDFHEFLKSNKFRSKIPNILKEILKGVRELHELGFTHRDLKSGNIVLKLKPIQIRIIDFGRSVT